MNEPASAESRYVVLTEEPNLMRAHWIAGAIEAAGIPTIVDDDTLADEFAVSQKAMGLLPIRVHVPADRLEEARTVFLDLSQPIPSVEEDEDEGEEAAAPGAGAKRPLLRLLGWLVLLAALVAAAIGIIGGG